MSTDDINYFAGLIQPVNIRHAFLRRKLRAFFIPLPLIPLPLIRAHSRNSGLLPICAQPPKSADLKYGYGARVNARNEIVFSDPKDQNLNRIGSSVPEAMKQLSLYIRLFFGLAGIACTVIGCATTNATEHVQVCTVMALSGGAQYWEGDSDRVHSIRQGDHIPPGSTIQTASGPGNYVTLTTGEYFLRSNRRSPAVSGDRLIIYDNTILKLNKTAFRSVGGNRILDTRMLLLQGSILFNRETNPSAQASKFEIAALQQERPYFELRTSNVVVRGECATFWSSARGITGVLQGRVAVERIDQKIIKEVLSSQKYDAVTGEIRPIEDDVKRNLFLMLKPDLVPPAAPPAPAFQASPPF